MSTTQIIQQPRLSEDNLIPIYLIQDKLKQNFKKTNNFIQHTYDTNEQFGKKLSQLQNNQIQMKDNFENKMIQMEKKIVHQISLQLEGRIAIAIGKSIQSFTQKMDKKQQKMGDLGLQFDRKLQNMKKSLKYEISQQNQKSIMKQTKNLQNKLKDVSQKVQKSFQNNRTIPNLQQQHHAIPSSQATQFSSSPQPKNSQQENTWQVQHQMIKQIQNRVKSLQDFSISIDKRLYNSLTSLKQSWKELGTQLLDHKKSLSKKFDELKLDFIKLKQLKQFSVAPNKVQQQFKTRLAQKFTDIYQLLSKTLTKNQFQGTIQRYGQRINRHDDDFIQIRKQLAANNEYFTFYANNADQEDLKQNITNVQQHLKQYKIEQHQKILNINIQSKKKAKQLENLNKKLVQLRQLLVQKTKLIQTMNQTVGLVDSRIKSLEDFNKFGPDKLQKIHNSLQMNFSAEEQQLINNKNKKNFEQSQKQMKVELVKMKDELFVLTSQNQVKDQELSQMKKMYQQLEERLSKVKGETEQAIVTRKPWVCLSCDRQQKQKQQKRKQSSKRKIQPFKGFGPQRNSEKNIKLIPNPPFQQRFQVYQKFKQKYLSDTVKLPQIYKQKLTKQKQTSFHG